MSISNISGTTMPSFKLKKNGGIELISAAIRNEEGKVVSNRFKVKTIDSGVEKLHEVAYYDTHIASDEIRCFKYIDRGGLRVILRDGTEIDLDNLIKKDAITFNKEENYEEGRVVTIGKILEDGTELKGSEYGISNSYTGQSSTNAIPTIRASEAIAAHMIDNASIGLMQRVNGDNVSNDKK